MSKAVAKKDNTELAAQESMFDAFEMDAGNGFEEADEASYAIPFLKILQSLSPQIDEDDGNYVEGAKVGMIFNTVTSEIMNEVKVLPCYQKRSFLEWVPRSAGGGFAGEHNTGSDVVKETEARGERDGGKMIMENGNEMMDTRNHYVLIIKDDGSFSPAIISMSSTQIKVSKIWMSRMNEVKLRNKAQQLYTPPMYSHYFNLTTKTESKGDDKWKGWLISSPELINNPEHYVAGKEFAVTVRSGEANVDYSKMEDTKTEDF